MKAGVFGTGVVASTGTVTVKVMARLVIHWGQIAIEQERHAREGRERVLSEHAAGNPLPMQLELHPAMMTSAACAHSLDALYTELAELVGPETLAAWQQQTRRHGRWGEVAAILGLALDVDVGLWRPRLRALFVERRNPAVHPKAKYRETQQHPVLPTNVAPEYVLYCVETANESVDLLLEILTACVESPKPPLAAWAADTRWPVEQLKELRVHPDAPGITGA